MRRAGGTHRGAGRGLYRPWAQGGGGRPWRMMAANGFYNTWSVMMLNVLVGNLSLEGGVFVGGGKFNGFAEGPRYNLVDFPGLVKPKGLNIARSKAAYETSDEYREKVAAGVSPWPARAPWYPFVAGQLTELLTSALAGIRTG